MGIAAAATPVSAASSSTAGSRRLRRMRPFSGSSWAFLELHFRDRLAPRRGLEERLLLEAAQPGDDARREDPDAQIVVAHRFVEALALHGDAVLCSLELALERQEVLVALELGVPLDGDEQAREGPPELVLGLLELLEGGRVIEELRRRLDAAGTGARPGHLFEDGFLLGGEALDRLDEVGDEVGAALVDVLDLGPLF